MGRFRRFLPKLQTKTEVWLTIAGATAIAAMMGITTVDVVMRKAFHSPVRGSYEYVSLLFVGVVFLGLAYAQSRNEHIQISVLYDRLPLRLRRLIQGLVLGLALGIFGIITWFSAITTVWAWQTGDTILGAMQVLTWPSRVFVPLGTGALFLRLLVQLIRLLRRGELIEETSIPTE